MTRTDRSPVIAERFRPFGTTIFAEMTALAAEHDAVNLSQGFPDSGGAVLGIDAAARALHAGQNQYAPMPGLMELRSAIADWAGPTLGGDPDPATEITVTSGATEAIAATMLGLFEPGDEVVLFEPFYDSYRAAVAMCGGVPRYVTMRPDGGRFSFDPQELERAFGPRTRAVLVNTPHNPTGTVLNEQELEQIARLCRKHDAIAVSDEVYETQVFNGEHRSIASHDGMRDRTVVISSIGKTFSLTGWKVGWVIAPPRLTAGIRAAHQFLTFAVPTPLQHASAVLLEMGRDEAERIASHHRAMRDLLCPALERMGYRVFNPEGTYFVMADHRKVSGRLGLADDRDLCRWLTIKAGVAAIPPSAFYEHPERGAAYIRFAVCKKQPTIEEAIRRLEVALR